VLVIFFANEVTTSSHYYSHDKRVARRFMNKKSK